MRVQRTTVNEEKKIKTYLQGDGGGHAVRTRAGWQLMAGLHGVCMVGAHADSGLQ